MFSVDLADKSGEIRGTLFRDLVDRYCDVLQEGTMYKITDTSARIKPANKQWTSLSHQYEINFGNAVFEDCDDDSSIPLINCSFIKLSELPQHAPDEKVDIVAIVKSAEPVTSFISKRDNAERKKREVTIVDDSGCDVRLTFWGDVGTKPDEFWAVKCRVLLTEQAHSVSHSTVYGYCHAGASGCFVKGMPHFELWWRESVFHEDAPSKNGHIFTGELEHIFWRAAEIRYAK